MRRKGFVLGVFSAKGGVGKTTTVSNLGAALAQKKKGKVVIMETNMTASNLGLYLGVVDPPVVVQDLLYGKLRPEEALVKTPYGLHLLPGSVAYTDEVMAVDFSTIVDTLKKKYEIILLDTAPGFAPEVTAAMRVCDAIMVCCQPQIPAIAGTLQTLRMAERLKVPVIGCVLTRVTGRRWEIPISEIRRTLGWPALAEIPEDEMVPESITRGTPVVLWAPRSPAAVGYLKLSAQLLSHLRRRKVKKGRKKTRRSRRLPVMVPPSS
ncbi:MAG: AAA family ATPase [Candidatus Hadarchaeales archaeon]